MCGEEKYDSTLGVQRAKWKWIFGNAVGIFLWRRIVLRWRLRLSLTIPRRTVAFELHHHFEFLHAFRPS
jgi:hypothetical protein